MSVQVFVRRRNKLVTSRGHCLHTAATAPADWGQQEAELKMDA